jgi:DNA polymerase III alpha subunit
MLTSNKIENLIEGVMRHGPEILSRCQTHEDLSQYINRLHVEHLNYPVPSKEINYKHWFVPKQHCPNLVEMLYGMCKTEEEKNRVSQELELYIKHGMIDILHVMKYVVDVLRDNNIVWGVGRGSSVASYVLFLIGVHRIDSLKYDIPINEFFKGEK